jgi:hypothetical protein
VQFSVDAGDAGEGNLEITISAKGFNIPTQVHPQGNAKYDFRSDLQFLAITLLINFLK